MAKRIIWATEALSDRIQILDYWIERLGSKEYPVRLDNMFREVVQLISQYPHLGRALENRDERCIVKDHYQLFYREADDTIEILHIWDTRRNPDDFSI
jgi:toxin YoeB